MDNYRSVERGGARVQASLCDRQVVTEVSSDFSLPDYQPEIKRLLRVHATVSPPDKYVGTGNAEFSGTVDYNILYAGNDGALCCVTQTGEYQFNVPVEMTSDFEIGDGLVCDVETVPDLATGRVAAPRKLSVKCRLRSRIRLYGTRVIEEEISGAPSDSVQKLKGSAECARVFVGTGDPLQLGDEILFDAQSENLRVICADAQVYIMEALAGSGCVNCRGEVCMKLICARDGENEAPFVQLRRIPFTHSVLCDGAEVNCDCYADGVCSDIAVTVEDGRIMCEIAVRLEAHAQRNERIEFARDAYSTVAKGENKYADWRFPVALKCISGNFSLNTMLSMEEAGVRPGQTVVDLSLVPSALELVCEGGKYVLTGRCRCHALLYSEEGLAAQEFEIPFRYETEGSAEVVADYDVNMTPITCRARADGERLAVDAELAVNIATRCVNTCQILTSAVFDEEIARSGASYTVCYPSREDTLWTVAKRYHRLVSEIAEMNPLTGSPAADARDSLTGISYLLV